MKTIAAKTIIILSMVLVFVAIKYGVSTDPAEWQALLIGTWKDAALGVALFVLGFFWRGVTHELNQYHSNQPGETT